MRKIIRSKMRKGEKSAASAFTAGLIAAMIAEIIVLAIAAGFTASGIAAESIMPVLAACCAALSSFAGAFVCAVSTPKLRLPMTLAVGAGQLAVNFALGMLIGGGVGINIPISAAFIIGALAAGIISALKKGKNTISR